MPILGTQFPLSRVTHVCKILFMTALTIQPLILALNASRVANVHYLPCSDYMSLQLAPYVCVCVCVCARAVFMYATGEL